MPVKIQELADHWGVTKARVSQLWKAGCPRNSLKAADLWRENRGEKRAPTNKGDCKVADEKWKGRPMKAHRPAKTGDSLQDALNNAIAVADGAFIAYEAARINHSVTQSIRLSEHSKALDARLKAEKAYREELVRRQALVPKSEIVDRCRRCMETVLRRLKKLPQEQGPQCNPENALMAVTILEREVNEIINSGHNALNDLQS